MEKVIIIPGTDGYSTNQCGDTMTVGELIEELSNYDETTPIYLSTGQRTGIQYQAVRFIDTEYTDEEE